MDSPERSYTRERGPALTVYDEYMDYMFWLHGHEYFSATFESDLEKRSKRIDPKVNWRKEGF